MTCIWHECRRAAPPFHAHCAPHERRVLREAFGPVSWQDRAAVNDLPASAVGGVSIAAPVPVPPFTGVPPAQRWRPQAVEVATGR